MGILLAIIEFIHIAECPDETPLGASHAHTHASLQSVVKEKILYRGGLTDEFQEGRRLLRTFLDRKPVGSKMRISDPLIIFRFFFE